VLREIPGDAAKFRRRKSADRTRAPPADAGFPLTPGRWHFHLPGPAAARILLAYARNGRRQGRGPLVASWRRPGWVLTCGHATRNYAIFTVIYPAGRADRASISAASWSLIIALPPTACVWYLSARRKCSRSGLRSRRAGHAGLHLGRLLAEPLQAVHAAAASFSWTAQTSRSKALRRAGRRASVSGRPSWRPGRVRAEIIGCRLAPDARGGRGLGEESKRRLSIAPRLGVSVRSSRQ
jgi:hypothetical protein